MPCDPVLSSCPEVGVNAEGKHELPLWLPFMCINLSTLKPQRAGIKVHQVKLLTNLTFHTGMLVEVSAALILNQVPAQVPGRQQKVVPSASPFASYVGDVDKALGIGHCCHLGVN